MLDGGSVAVSNVTATALSGAVPGIVRCKSLTIRNKVGNTGNITVGKANVAVGGNPAIMTLAVGESLTFTGSKDDGDRDAGLGGLTVDFGKLFAIAVNNGDILQIAFAG